MRKALCAVAVLAAASLTLASAAARAETIEASWFPEAPLSGTELAALSDPATDLGPGDHLAGHGFYSVQPFGPTSIEVGARSDADGSNPTGHITVQTEDETPPSPQILHGDVGEGCLNVTLNRAVAVGQLPESEQFDIPSGRIEFIAVVAEDNGQPVMGQPVDRAFTVLLRAAPAASFCAGLLPATLTTIPVESGNFVIRDS